MNFAPRSAAPPLTEPFGQTSDNPGRRVGAAQLEGMVGAEYWSSFRIAADWGFWLSALFFSGNDAPELYLIEWLRGHFLPNQPVADGVTKWRQILRRIGPRRFTAVSRSVLVRQMLEG